VTGAARSDRPDRSAAVRYKSCFVMTTRFG